MYFQVKLDIQQEKTLGVIAWWRVSPYDRWLKRDWRRQLNTCSRLWRQTFIIQNNMHWWILHNNTRKMYWDSTFGFCVDFKPVYACMFVLLLHLQCIFNTVLLHLNLSKSSCGFLSFAGECKYDFQAWGECDSTMRMKTRTGVLKRALMDANCPNTVSATKPCGKPKTKIQGTRTHT